MLSSAAARQFIEATYAPTTLARYIGAAKREAVEDEAPHVWQTSARAFAAMLREGSDQSICISGESSP